jgi:general secretion pathway protein G
MKTFPKPPRAARQARGFTLLEIVIVIALIVTIMAIVAGRIMGNQKRAEYKLAETQLQTLAGKIDQYQSDVGRLPDSLGDLVTAPANGNGWLGPYSREQELQDPWHHPIQYRHPGDEGRAYQLTSLGADGQPGGDGVDKDITAP